VVCLLWLACVDRTYLLLLSHAHTHTHTHKHTHTHIHTHTHTHTHTQHINTHSRLRLKIAWPQVVGPLKGSIGSSSGIGMPPGSNGGTTTTTSSDNQVPTFRGSLLASVVSPASKMCTHALHKQCVMGFANFSASLACDSPPLVPLVMVKALAFHTTRY